MNKIILLTVGLALLAGCEDKHMKAGAKFTCFTDGNMVYKSNIRPEYKGGDWFVLNGKLTEVDGCFCNGCIGF